MGSLIETFYDATLDHRQWEGAATRVAETFRADQAVFHLCEARTFSVLETISHNRDSSFSHAYNQHFVRLDPWVNYFPRSGVLERHKTIVACTQNIISDHAFQKSEIYADFAKPQDIHFRKVSQCVPL